MKFVLFGSPIDFNYGGRGRAATRTSIKLSTRLAGRQQTLGTMKIGTRTSKEENASILFCLSSCHATVLVKQVTQDRTVHSRLHPVSINFDRIYHSPSSSTLPVLRYNNDHPRTRRGYFILVWKFFRRQLRVESTCSLRTTWILIGMYLDYV